MELFEKFELGYDPQFTDEFMEYADSALKAEGYADKAIEVDEFGMRVRLQFDMNSPLLQFKAVANVRLDLDESEITFSTDFDSYGAVLISSRGECGDFGMILEKSLKADEYPISELTPENLMTRYITYLKYVKETLRDTIAKLFTFNQPTVK